jgi:5'-deoxynucleotidase YfbR-like HD superfamily hydrolase
VGQHTHDACVLLNELFPDARKEVLVAMMLHDYGERWVGDLPCVAGWDNGELGRAYRMAEATALAENGISLPQLTAEENHTLNVVDKLELWLWCQEQYSNGNSRVIGALNRLQAYFDGLEAQGRLPACVVEIVAKFMWRRTS